MNYLAITISILYSELQDSKLKTKWLSSSSTLDLKKCHSTYFQTVSLIQLNRKSTYKMFLKNKVLPGDMYKYAHKDFTGGFMYLGRF
jgi:hypothetical protein